MSVWRKFLDWFHFELEAPEVKYAEHEYEKRLISLAEAQREYREAEKRLRAMDQLIDWRIGGY